MEEKAELLYRLKSESIAIRNSFAILVTHTQISLRNSGTAAEDLKTLFGEAGLEELAKQVDSSDTIPAILGKVRGGNYWSFFNYELLAQIINCFCKGTPLITELDCYISELKSYCQHRVSEVPRGSLRGEDLDLHSLSVFKVKMDDIFNLQRVKDLQRKLEKILNKKPIQLIDVEHGCVELTFKYFNGLYPIKEEKAALAKIGLKWLGCFKLVKSETGTTLSKLPASAPIWKPAQSSSRTLDKPWKNLAGIL